MPATIIINNARLSFDKNLFEPNKKEKRSCNIILLPDTQFFELIQDDKNPSVKRKVQIKGVEGLDAIIADVLKAKFNGKVPAKFENWAVRANTDAVSTTTGERYTGYEDDDGKYMSPSRYAKQGYPAFVRQGGQVIDLTTANGLGEAMALFYAGCFVNAKVNLAAYETKEDNVTKRGVTTFLEALQFLRDGDKFGGGSANADGFDAVEEEDDDL